MSSAALLAMSCSGGVDRPSAVPADALTVFQKIQESAYPVDAPPPAPKTVSVYLDGSLSMRGFAAASGDHPIDSAYRDLLLEMPHVVASVLPDDRPLYFRFGSRIQRLPSGMLLQAADPSFYSCKACDNQESRIDLAVDSALEAGPNALAVIITDLFLADLGEGSDTNAMIRPLGNALERGLSVGILGIRSGFSGVIYDLPKTGVYNNATERPFFSLMIGNPEHVLDLSRGIAERALDEDVERHFTLFSSRRRQRIATTPMPIDPIRGAVAVEAPDETGFEIVENGSPALEYDLAQHAEPLVFTIDLAQLQLAHTPLPAHLELDQSFWTYGASGSWLVQQKRNVATFTQDGSKVTVTFPVAGPRIRGFNSHEVHFAQLVLKAKGTGNSSDLGWFSAPGWFNEWGLRGRHERDLLERLESQSPEAPRFFPVLNLGYFYQALVKRLEPARSPQGDNSQILAVISMALTGP